MNKNRNTFPINIGYSSILLIFVVLCLVSFAALSIVSANADYKLTSKVTTRTNSYYQSCNKAEENLANIDKTLHDIYQSTSSRDEYFDKAGKSSTFLLPISDSQSLQVSLDVRYPESTDSSEKYYKITCWKTITTTEMEYDYSLPVMK